MQCHNFRNSIGETKRSIQISVVTIPKMEKEYKVKKGKELVLPCIQPAPDVTSVWTHKGA